MSEAPFASRFRRRAPEVEAVQFTGTPESCSEVTDFLGGPYAENHNWNLTTTTGGCLRKRHAGFPNGWIARSEGNFGPGCWIIRTGESDESYRVMRDEDFRRCYEAVA